MGLSLVFASPLLRFYVTPRVEKAPVDVRVTSTSIGSGSYFSPKLRTVVTNARLQNILVANGDPSRSTRDVAVISLFSRTRDLARGDVDFGSSVVAFDRRTGDAVDCCGAHPKAAGLTVKFPFGTRRSTYSFWDATARQAYPARFERSATLDGIRVYEFETTVPSTVIGTQQIPGFIVAHPEMKTVAALRTYRATTRLWVEPTTGVILRAAQRSRQWLAGPTGGTLLSLSKVWFATDRATVSANVKRARAELLSLRLVRAYVPVGGLCAGVLLAAAGVLLLLRSGAGAMPHGGSSAAASTGDPGLEPAARSDAELSEPAPTT